MGILDRLFGRGGGDGSSAALAVSVGSVADEYAWLRRHHPGYQLLVQMLQTIEGKPYDVLEVRDAEGVKRTVYFDISRFYGKS